MSEEIPANLNSESDAAKAVNLILFQAIKDRASDIHFDPTEDGAGRIRFRIDGALMTVTPSPDFAGIVDRLKIMAGLDPADRRAPKDARIILKANNQPLNLRLSTMPTAWGERAAVRLLPNIGLNKLDQIVTPQALQKVRSLCHLPSGVVICTGPAGSGKTTLLYAMLMEIDRDRKCVVSLEDPIEYFLPGIAQTQISPQTGLTYARALRHLLRQDPDVVMLGDVRDVETLEATITCAVNGNLVLYQLHTNTAPGAIKRLIEVGLEPYRVNAALAGVIAQRLVRKLCEKCRQPITPPLHSMPPEAVEFVQSRPDATFHAAKGCDACSNTGYRGRVALHEILVVNDAIRQAVTADTQTAAIRSAAIAGGMKTLLIDGLEKAAAGMTSIDEVLRVVPAGLGD